MALRVVLNFLYASSKDFLNIFSQMRTKREEKLFDINYAAVSKAVGRFEKKD
ncbi:MAG: hypothetical protein GXO85_08520 [Chlorobi bacterium]|nr:hypothetical protein [Chlorobiota bacterium]